MISFCLCKHCCDELEDISVDTLRLWVVFCHRAIVHGNIFPTINFFERELKDLEELGYVVSHEEDLDFLLLIRVNGYHYNEDTGHFFCLDSFSHLEVI